MQWRMTPLTASMAPQQTSRIRQTAYNTVGMQSLKVETAANKSEGYGAWPGF
jgi:hypothetical protein